MKRSMTKVCGWVFVASLFWVSSVFGASLYNLNPITSDNGDPGNYTLDVKFSPLASDVGQQVNIYIFANYKGRIYLKNQDGFWPAFVPGDALPVYRTIMATRQMDVDIVRGVNVPDIGGTIFYVGYGRNDADLISGKYALVHVARSGGGEGCNSPALQMSPVKTENISTLMPLGSLVAGDHTYPTPHMYFYVKNDTLEGDIESPVHSPGNITVTGVSRRNYGMLGGRSNYTDYGITFNVCGKLQMYFIHLRSLVHPQLQQASQTQCKLAATQNPNESFCQIGGLNISLKVGEQIGTAGDKVAGVYGLDMGARDYSFYGGRAFSNPDRWCPGGNQNIFGRCYAVCPLDYLPQAERIHLSGLFSDGRITRTDEPRCGTVYQDFLGTAQGYWVGPGTDPTRTELPQLFLGQGTLVSGYNVFVTGTSIPNLPVRQYVFDARNSGRVNRAFNSIEDEQIYCFESFYWRESDLKNQVNPMTGTILLLKLSNGGNNLSVEAQSAQSCGNGPWTLTSNSVLFER